MVAKARETKYALSPPIPMNLLTNACEQAHSQGWEVVSTMVVGVVAEQGKLLTAQAQQQAVPAICILCKQVFDADIVDVPYPRIAL